MPRIILKRSKPRLNKKLLFATILVIGLMIILSYPNINSNVRASKTRCSGFKVHDEAQLVLQSDPETYSCLDPDGDGLACEDLPLK